MEQQKRNKTFTAAILNIVSYSIYILFTAVLIITSISLLAGVATAGGADGAVVAGAAAGLMVGYFIRLALDIVCLVLSCKCIKISKMSVQDYAAKKGIIASCYIINIILVVFGLISTLMSGISLLSLIDVALWAMLIVAAVFFAIDLKKNQEKVNQEQAQIFAETASSTKSAEEKEVSSIDKLDELNKMKADGLISDEEFEKMKKDLMK